MELLSAVLGILMGAEDRDNKLLFTRPAVNAFSR